MLDILKKNYKKVYIWLQGEKDLSYLNEITDVTEIELVNWELQEYDELLSSIDNLDYIGTRLHAGIRALNHKKRSIIITVDNRTREIAKDTHLVVVERENIVCELENLLISDFQTEIQIPIENIELWKNQFRNI